MEAPSDLIDWKRQRSLLFSQNVVSYVLRFIKVLLSRVNDKLQNRVYSSIPELRSVELLPFITATERESALRVLIRNHQRNHLPKTKQNVLKQMKIREDEQGLLRCQGRLGKSSLQANARHPYLIASKTALARLIVQHAHTHLNCGTGHTMANVWEQFWIPKLRQMVRTVITKCVPCQKMNNLPYRYPEMDDLPERRVQRSRPFEHIGIDYFGPLYVKRDWETIKVYGIILTCTVTRLVHLELVPDMSTDHLLLALRRFFARRGVPSTITSDNGPNFLLGEQILREAVLPVVSDVAFAQAMATKGIVWKTITPYAPWQGAMYERLIKSVKYSLYKVIRRTIPTQEVMETFLVEIEGSLNSRPLTYQEERWEETPLLRSIDFIQRDLIITYPFETIGVDDDDPSFVPSAEAAAIQTRKQAEDALKTSHQLTERFWSIWSHHYLTSLRELHKLYINSKRGTSKQPSKGTVVLISEPVLPRNAWKMGIITKLPEDANNVIREAEIRLPNGRNIRRPVNFLIPLELGDENQRQETREEADSMPSTEGQNTEDTEAESEPRYNLRSHSRKPRTSYAIVNLLTSAVTVFLLLMTLAKLPSPTAATSVTEPTQAKGEMRCTPGGVQLISQSIRRFEVCAEEHCTVRDNPKENETILFPPEITLHPYHVQWKFSDGFRLTTLDVVCPSNSFCENVHCWFCTANIFNPECSPRTAIGISAVLVYVTVAAIYLLCYVPVVLGKPLRIIANLMWCCFKGTTRKRRQLWITWRNRYRQRQRNVDSLLQAPLIAATIASLLVITNGCRNIDVLHQQATICSFAPNGSKQCTLEAMEVFKLNSFKKTACIRLLYNKTLIKELQFQWKQLRLTCVQEDLLFTRNTVQKVIDSKRCAHSGSCVEQKCASINASTILPELEQGNGYPGITRCVESCGGPGCGCFYLSSGCLVYRIFNVPADKKIYKIFKCYQWNENFHVEFTSITGYGQKIRKRVLSLEPTILFRMDNMIITLSTVTMPPTPELSSAFITDGSEIAIWRHGNSLTLICDSEESARTLNCTVQSNCQCDPAESKVKCACNNINVTDIFEKEVENRLPIRRPWLTFETDDSNPMTVSATVPSLVTAELLVHLKDRFDRTVVKVTDSVCRVDDAVLQGCYNCSQGARTNISCFTDGEPVIASIRCEDQFFTAPCQRKGSTSTIVFSSKTARVYEICEVSCGSTTTTFELTGILQWTRTIHGTMTRILNGESSLYDEMVFPDFFHILDVMLSGCHGSSNCIGNRDEIRNGRQRQEDTSSAKEVYDTRDQGTTATVPEKPASSTSKKVNAAITEEWDNKNVMEAARKLAELKERRSRLQAQESTLDRELLYLGTKMRNLDPTEDRHRMDDPQSRDHRRDSSRR